jgi:membrane protease YdiL (CAAX protease family)
MIINFVPGVEVTSLRHLTEILAITLMVGFVEEAVFRGLMLSALKAHGPWKAAIITALLFGLTHALNVLTGKSMVEDAAQIFYAVAIGFAYAALVLHKGILWPLVLAHFLIDFVNFIQKPGFTYPPFWEVLIVVSIAVVFTAYGFFCDAAKESRESDASIKSAPANTRLHPTRFAMLRERVKRTVMPPIYRSRVQIERLIQAFAYLR